MVAADWSNSPSSLKALIVAFAWLLLIVLAVLGSVAVYIYSRHGKMTVKAIKYSSGFLLLFMLTVTILLLAGGVSINETLCPTAVMIAGVAFYAVATAFNMKIVKRGFSGAVKDVADSARGLLRRFLRRDS